MSDIPPNLLHFAKHDVTGYALSPRTISPYQRKYKFKNSNVLCKCGHYLGIVGAKWQHKFDLTLIEHYDDVNGKQMTHIKGEIDYQQKCYYCACVKPMPAVDVG